MREPEKKNLKRCLILIILIITTIIINLFVFIIGPSIQEDKVINRYLDSLIFQHNKSIKYYDSYALDNKVYTYYDEANYYIVNPDINTQIIVDKDKININNFKDYKEEDYKIAFGYSNDRFVVSLISDTNEIVYDLETYEFLFKYERDNV